MAFFSSLFGKKQQPAPVDPLAKQHDAIKNLKTQQETMEKRRKIAETKREQEEANMHQKLALAKQAPNKRLADKYKKEAAPHLRRMKQLTKEVEDLDDSLFNLETMVYNLENAGQNKTNIEAMRAFKAGMAAIADDIDQVEDLKDEVTELMDDNVAVNEALKQPFMTTGAGAVTQDEIEDELDAYMMEDDNYDPAGMASTGTGLPAVQTFNPQINNPVGPVAVPALPETQPVFPQAGPPVETAEEKYARLEADMAI